ncbi:MAG: UDP-N-acetylmuramoyl-tripeptide--D-alanyl-D-alanine ligase [Bacillus sp. (in: firmicutes)]
MIKRTLAQIAKMIGLDGFENRNEQITGVEIDSRKVVKGSLFVPFQGENTDGHAFVESAIANGAVAALWQKDVPNPPENVPILFVDDTLTALQKLAESYLQQVSPKVIGVTGSNGKTTTKDMIASLLSGKYKVHKTNGNYNNHLGLPLTVLGMEEDTEVAVLEMGMSGRGEIELLSKLASPHIAVITNIGESHLLDLGSREGIAEAKLEITTGLREGGVIIYHGDEPLLASKLAESKWQTRSFGKGTDNTIYPLMIESDQERTTFTTNISEEALSIPVLGHHNVLNALAAILVARELDVDAKAIAEGLSALKVTNMRMELVEGQKGEKLINDAYNASPTSMKAAIDLVVDLKGFRQKYLVLGDMLELGPDEAAFHRQIGEAIKPGTIDHVFTFGELGMHIAQGAQSVLGEGHVHAFLDKQALIQQLKSQIQPNDIVLVKASRGMKLEDVVQALRK